MRWRQEWPLRGVGRAQGPKAIVIGPECLIINCNKSKSGPTRPNHLQGASINEQSAPQLRQDRRLKAPSVGASSRAFLRLAMLGMLLGAGASLVGLQLTSPHPPWRGVGPVLMMVVAGLGLYLLSRGKVRASLAAMIYGLWLAVAMIAVFTGGVHAPVLMALPGILLVAGLMTPRRQALAAAALTLLLTAGLVIADAQNLLPAPWPVSSVRLGWDQSLLYAVSLLLGLLLAKIYQDRMLALRQVSQDLARRSNQLEAAQAELHRAQLVANVGSWVGDIEADTIRPSVEMQRILGLADASPLTFAQYLTLVHPQDRGAVRQAWRASLKGAAFDQEHRVMVGEAQLWVRQKAEVSYSSAGWALRAVGIVQDVTQRRHAEQALKESESRYRTLVELTPQPILVHRNGRLLFVNPAAVKLLGANEAHEVLQRSAFDWIHPEHRAFHRARLAHIKSGSAIAPLVHSRLIRLDESSVEVEIQATRILYAGLPAIQVAIHDISVLKAQQLELERMAHYDTLTGLPNRVLFADRLQQAMAHALRHGLKLAVVYLDLDGFKAVNDRHGHDAGDQLLIALAGQMKQALREGDSLARLGGDEFVAVFRDLVDGEACVPMLARLLEAARRPVSQAGQILQVSASLGVTFYPQMDDVNADQLLRQADQSMYQAKLAGKNRYCFFDAEQDRQVRGHHQAQERIRQALAANEFVLHYQPKVNLRSGAVVGAEALIRWQHPVQGLLAPDEFLPLIESHPLAIELGEWVIHTALRDMVGWRDHGLDIPVSVNVGAYQLQHHDFVARLSAVLSAHPRVRAGDLGLEVLESSALDQLTPVSQVMESCRQIGVSFALDDFGTGYSSLTYLKRLPVATLKIDRSFVRDMLDDPDDMTILQGVIGLAGAFRCEVIAEGVESARHGDCLLQLGCELAQGFGIAYPMPGERLSAWSSAWRHAPVWSDRVGDTESAGARATSRTLSPRKGPWHPRNA